MITNSNFSKRVVWEKNEESCVQILLKKSSVQIVLSLVVCKSFKFERCVQIV